MKKLKLIKLIFLLLLASCQTFQGCKSYCGHSERLRLDLWDKRCDCSKIKRVQMENLSKLTIKQYYMAKELGFKIVEDNGFYLKVDDKKDLLLKFSTEIDKRRNFKLVPIPLIFRASK